MISVALYQTIQEWHDAGVETRITVEHHGWHTVPQQHVARHTFPNAVFLQRHGEWWQALLSSFARVVSRASGAR